MERQVRYQRISHKVVTGVTNFAHSVLMMVCFWVLLDLMQSHIVTKPAGPSLVTAMVKMPLPTPEVVSHSHPYGYFAGLRNSSISTEPETHDGPVSQVPQKLVKVAHKTPKVVKVVKKSPVTLITHHKTQDARGPAPVYARVDL